MISIKDIGIDSKKPISEFMVKNVEFVYDSEKIIDVIEKICKNGFRRYPVVSKKRTLTQTREEVIGIITVMDILDAFLRGVDLKKPISDIMTRDIVYCKTTDTLQFVLKKFQFARKGGFPVLNKNKELEGLITEHDIIKLFRGYRFNTNISEVMTHKPFFIKPTSFWNSLNILVNTRYRKIPLIEDGTIIGLLTERFCLEILLKNNFKKERLNFPTKEIVIKDIYLVHPESDISEAIDLMVRYRVGGIIVTRNKSLVGIITERDIIERL